MVENGVYRFGSRISDGEQWSLAEDGEWSLNPTVGPSRVFVGAEASIVWRLRGRFRFGLQDRITEEYGWFLK